jgi:hypothetical protein
VIGGDLVRHTQRNATCGISLLPCRDQKRHNSPRVKYSKIMAEPAEALSSELPDFSLILGGPLFQLLRRAHLCGDVAELVWRRMIAMALITWLPLLTLSNRRRTRIGR